MQRRRRRQRRPLDHHAHSRPEPLAFAAAQSSDEPWQVITPSADGTYTFTAVERTYGIVAVCGDGEFAMTTVLQATAAETTTPSLDCYANQDDNALLTGTISGASGQTAVVTVAGSGYGLQQIGNWDYSMPVPEGTWTVFAHREPQDDEVDKIIRWDGVELAEAAPTVIDFNFATEGFAPETHTVSLEGLQSGELANVGSMLRSSRGGTTLGLGRSTSGAYRALPASELVPEDIRVVTATAVRTDGSYRQVRRWLTASKDFSVTFPSPPPAAVVDSEAADPYLRMRFTIPSGIDADLYDVHYTQSQASSSTMIWDARLSKGYVDAANIDAYTLPDLSALEGFTPAWALEPGTPVTWELVTVSSTASAKDLLGSDMKASADNDRSDTITSQPGSFPL